MAEGPPGYRPPPAQGACVQNHLALGVGSVFGVFFPPFFLECPGRLDGDTLPSTSPRSAFCAAAEQGP